jgi:hypothetical protein
MRNSYYGSFNKEEAESSSVAFFLSIIAGVALCFLSIYFYYSVENLLATFISLSGGLLVIIIGVGVMLNERNVN